MRSLTSIGLLLCLLLSGCGQQDLSSPNTISLSAIPTEVEIGQRVVVNATLITTNALPTLDWRSTLHPSLRLIRQDTLPSQSEDDQIWTTQTQFVFTGFYETNAPVFAASRADRSSGIPPSIELPVQDLRFRAPETVTNDVPMIGDEELPDFRTDEAIAASQANNRTWWIGGIAGGIAGGIGALIVTLLLRRSARPQSPDQRALDALSALANRKQSAEAFAADLSRILLNFLSDRYGLPARTYTTEELLKATEAAPPWGSQQQPFIRDFLRTCDEVKFASRGEELSNQLTTLSSRLSAFVAECTISETEVDA